MIKNPQTYKEWAIYRCQLTCKIGKKACEGRDIPDNVDPNMWIFYQLFCAIEELAMAMEDEKRD